MQSTSRHYDHCHSDPDRTNPFKDFATHGVVTKLTAAAFLVSLSGWEPIASCHCQLAAFDLQYKIVVQYGSLKGIKMPLAPFQVMRPQMQTLNYVTSKLRGLHMVLPACLGSPLYSELSLRCK